MDLKDELQLENLQRKMLLLEQRIAALEKSPHKTVDFSGTLEAISGVLRTAPEGAYVIAGFGVLGIATPRF